MKINEACQKTHILAIDVFVIMLVLFSYVMAFHAEKYEIIPEGIEYNIIDINGEQVIITAYQPQTNYTLIPLIDAKRLEQEQKSFTKQITLFGTIIFILYALTQWRRWKQKIDSWND